VDEGRIVLVGRKQEGRTEGKGQRAMAGRLRHHQREKRKKMVDGVCEILKVLIIVVRLRLPTLIHKRIGENRTGGEEILAIHLHTPSETPRIGISGHIISTPQARRIQRSWYHQKVLSVYLRS
jgi:hypothetical protein